MTVTVKPTGRLRVRVVTRSWGRKPQLVLQMEEHRKGTHFYHDGHSMDCIEVDETTWRDAQPEDLRIDAIHF